MTLRERCEKLYNDLPSELGKYKRHVDVIDQTEAFAREIRNEAPEVAALNARIKDLREMHSHVCDLLAAECEERNRLRKVVDAAREMRFYCLGSDGSTRNMIELFDDAIRELDMEKK